MQFKGEVPHNNKRLEVRAVFEQIVPDDNAARVKMVLEGVTLPSYNVRWCEADTTSRQQASFKFYSMASRPFDWGTVTVEPSLSKKLEDLVQGWYWEHLRSLSLKNARGAQ